MINSDNILAYIKYLYQKRHGQVAPAQLVSRWRNVEEHQIADQLQKLYQHWGWAYKESQSHEADFITLTAIINEDQAAKPTINPVVPTSAKRNRPPRKKRSLWVWMAPILILGLAYFAYDYLNRTKDNRIDVIEKTAGTLLPESIIEEPVEIIDSTELVEGPDTSETITSTEVSIDDRQNMANIRFYIFAEDDRNIDKMLELVSPNIYKYYDINYPTKAQLRSRYEHLWSITKNNTNYISDIKKVDQRKYEVYGSYEYVGLNTQERKQQNTHLLFEMDENNKLLSIDNAQ